MHKSNRREFLTQTAGVAVGVLAAGSTPIQAARSKPLSICLVSGSLEYKSDESLTAFGAYLEKQGIAKCSKAFRMTDQVCPGLENLQSADLMIVFCRRLKLAGDSLKYVKDYCNSGKPVLGIRTASHAFQTWPEFDREVLGGSYKNHYKAGNLVEIKIAEAARDNPILKGVRPFSTEGKLYKNPSNANDTTLLLTGSIPDHTEPVAWTRVHKGGRVFYTSLGHPKDFLNPNFRTLLLNAIAWTSAPK